MFFMVKAALPYLVAGTRINNTTLVTAYKGSPQSLNYSATKGAIVAFTRSLTQNFVKDEIHVNDVAPGPIWTPLIPSTFTEEQVAHFGAHVPMQRPGQPNRSRTGLCLPGQRRRFVYKRAGFASQRRCNPQ